MEPRVITDPSTFGRMFSQPFRRAGFRYGGIVPQGGIDLVAYLEGIAPVDEDHRALGFVRNRKHDGGSSGAVEPGEPLQPLGVGTDIFAHMFVGDRYDEAIQLAPGEFFPQGIEPF